MPIFHFKYVTHYLKCEYFLEYCEFHYNHSVLNPLVFNILLRDFSCCIYINKKLDYNQYQKTGKIMKIEDYTLSFHSLDKKLVG